MIIAMPRRSLVVTDESARHPFLMGLPPHVRRGAVAVNRPVNRGLSAQNVKDFLIAYSACFVGVSAFIA